MKTDRWDPEEELVTLVKPGTEKDVVFLCSAGALRFVEGRSVRGVPLRVARELAAQPGWWLEPYEPTGEERSQTA